MQEKDLAEACGLIARLRQRKQFEPKSELVKIEARIAELGVTLQASTTSQYWAHDPA